MSDPTEVIAKGMHDEYCDCDEGWDGHAHMDFAEVALAALRADGWELYRPEECPIDTVEGAPGQYRLVHLVPVSEGSE